MNNNKRNPYIILLNIHQYKKVSIVVNGSEHWIISGVVVLSMPRQHNKPHRWKVKDHREQRQERHSATINWSKTYKLESYISPETRSLTTTHGTFPVLKSAPRWYSRILQIPFLCPLALKGPRPQVGYWTRNGGMGRAPLSALILLIFGQTRFSVITRPLIILSFQRLLSS